MVLGGTTCRAARETGRPCLFDTPPAAPMSHRRRLACSLSPLCQAPRLGCVCEPCRVLRLGVKDEIDAAFLTLLAREQHGQPAPRLVPAAR